MFKFTRIIVCLFVFFSVGSAFAAGYVCDSYKQYTSCNPGYYISNCGDKRDGSTIAKNALTVGNSCEKCPDGYTCGGDLTCPLPPQCIKINLNSTENGGSGGTQTVYKKPGNTQLYSDDQCTVTLSAITKPTKANASFLGYYDTSATSGGETCINSTTGKWLSKAACDFTSETTVYARYGCSTGYYKPGTVSQIKGACSAQCNTISFDANGGTGGQTANLYKLTNDTKWYSNSTCTTQVTTAATPTYTAGGGKAFKGYYQMGASDVGEQFVTDTGALNPIKVTGNVSLVAIYECDKGHAWDGSTCSYCPSGTYKDTVGNTACTVCGENTYSNGATTACSACPSGYKNSGDTAGSHSGKASCKLTCLAGTQVVSEGAACTTPDGSWYTGVHTVYAGSTSPTSTVKSCTTNYSTPNTTTKTDHDNVNDCKATVTLHKNGGSGTIQSTTGTTNASITCTQGAACDFGSASGLTQTGYTFTGGWGTSASCSATTTSFSNPSGTYYACKTVNSYTCSAGYYLAKNTTSCATCPAGKYCNGGTYSFNASSDQGITGSVNAGYYSTGGGTSATPTEAGDGCLSDKSCGACANGTYSGAGAASCTDCPAADSTTQRTTFPDVYYPYDSVTGAYVKTTAPRVKRFTKQSWSSGGSSISGCKVTYTMENDAATSFVVESVGYNTSSGKYDVGGSMYYSSVKAGYYLDTKHNAWYCDKDADKRNMLYKRAIVCPAGSYCAGGSVPRCDAGTYEDEWGKSSCPANYANSAAGATAATSCYLTTSSTKFVETKKAAQVTCTAGGYCPGGVKVFYDSTGGRTACVAGTYNASTGSSAASACTSCVKGSYSDAGASSCTACQNGTTTSTAGYYSCNATCDNVANATEWETASWSSTTNTVTNLCKIKACATATKGTGVSSAAVSFATNACVYTGTCATGYSTSGGTNTDTTCSGKDCSCLARTFTIILDDNGGSGGTGTVKEVYATKWTNSSGTTITSVTKPTKSGVTVTYNANSGSVNPTSASTSYTFNGYYTAATGGTQRITSAGDLPGKTTFTGNTTLFAQWSCDGVTLPTPTRTGYTFNGWYTAASGGTKVADAGTAYCPISATTIYAQWTANTLTFNVNKNGGSGTCAGATSTTNGSFTCTYGGTCTAPSWDSSTCNISNGSGTSSKVLIGWNTSQTNANAGTVQYGLGASIKNIISSGSTTLYAVWGTPTCSVTNATATVATTSNNRPTCTMSCNTGYHVGTTESTTSTTIYGTAGQVADATSGSCNGNTITLSWANGGRGTAPTSPASCTYGGTFTMPAAMTATGYTFSNWSVNSKTFNAGQTSVACNSANLGKTSGTATITGTWTAKCNAITLKKDTNGGTGSAVTVYAKSDDTTLYTNDTCTTAATASTVTAGSKTNATFGGYYNTTNATGGTQCVMAGGTTLASGCTVKTATTFNAQYDCNTGWREDGTRVAGTCIGTISATSTDKSKTYNGSALSCNGVSVTTPSSGSTIKYCISKTTSACTPDSTTVPTVTNVADSGTVYYQVTATNYAAKTGNFKCTVTNATISATANNKTLTYNGTTTSNGSPQSCANVSVTTPSSGASITYSTTQSGTYSAIAPTLTNVGSTTVYYKVNATNYAEKTGSYTCTMGAKAMTVSAPTKTLTYDTSAQECAGGVTVSTPSSGATVTYSDSSTGTYGATVKKTNAGDYTIYYKVTGSNFVEKTGNYTCSIKKAACTLGISAATSSIAYPNSGTFTISGAKGTATVSSGTTTVATTSISGTTVTNESVKPGSSVITVTDPGNSNYNGCSKTHTVTVTKGTNPIALSALSGSTTFPSKKTFTVSDAQGTVTVSSSAPGVATASISGTTVTMTPVATGNATITATAAGNEYYESGSKTYALTVNKGTITVTETAKSKTYDGNALTCDGVTVTAPSSGTTIKYGTVSGTYNLTSAPTITNVADSKTIYYQVTAANYATETGSFNCTVSNATITATASDKTLTYNGTINTDGTPQSCANVSVSVPSSGATVTYSTTSGGTYSSTVPTLTNVGSTTVYYKVNATNYAEKTGSYTCTMAKKDCTITVKDGSTIIAANGTVNLTYPTTKTLTATASNGATVTLTSGTTANVTVSGKTLTPVKVGSSTITASASALSNFNTCPSVAFTATVGNGTITASASNKSLTYSGSAQECAGGVAVTAPSSGATVTYSATSDGTYGSSVKYTDAGEYTIYYKVTAANYTTKTGNYKCNIAKAACTLGISATSGNMAYSTTKTFTVSNSKGTATVKSSAETVATATISSGTVTMTSKAAYGTATITVTDPGNANYLGCDKTYALTVDLGTITLNNQSAGTAGTTAIYQQYNVNVYSDSTRSKAMTASANGITVPTKTGYTFGGYYDSTSYTNQYIAANGFITSAGLTAGKALNANGTWYAKWTVNTYECASGYYLDGVTCTECPAGYKCNGKTTYTYDGGVQGRTACSGGTEYQDAKGQTTCKTPSDGHYKKDNTSQQVCGADYFCKSGVRTACSTLGTGYKTGTGVTTASANTQCYLEVAGGKVRSGTTGVTLTSCAAGTAKAPHNAYYGTSYTCDDCTDGTYSSGGASACSSCTALNSEYTKSDGKRDAATTCYLTTSNAKFVAEANKAQTSCTAGGYCPGSVKVYYGSTGGRTACSTVSGGHYTQSAASSNSAVDCYLTTTAGMYVKTMGAGEETCAANSYCGGGTTVYSGAYGSRATTGGITACASPYTLSAAGSKVRNDCYLTTTGGNYVKTAGAGQTTCEKGNYCTGGSNIYYGGTVTGRSTTGGMTACAAGKYNASTGSSAASACVACAIGSYTSSTGQSSCTACQGGKTTSAVGKSSCDVNCSNAANVGAWKTATWSGNTLTNLCTIDSGSANACTAATKGTGAASATYTVTDNKCVYSGTCNANYYKPTASGATVSCTGCPVAYPNSVSGNAYTTDAYCYVTLTAGKQVANAGAGVTDCSKGSYCTSTDNIFKGTAGGTATYTGTKCQTGSYQDETGKTVCKACDAGKTNTGTGNTVACTTACTTITNLSTWATTTWKGGTVSNLCTVGTCNGASYKSGNTCPTCPTGYAANTNTGKTAASQCQASCTAGYAVQTENEACKIVTSGYQTGTHTVNYGSKTPTAADSTSPAAGTWYSCLTNYNASGTTAADHDARSDCKISCSAGTRIASANATSCTTPTGDWYVGAHTVAAGSASSVSNCNTGYTISGTTATNHDAEADCAISCAAGYYIPTAGGGCTACSAGKYCNGGSKNQTETLAVTGNCPAGTYSTGGATSSACTSALSGYTASVCATNKYSDAGASACTDCATANGYTNSGTAATNHAGIASCKVSCSGTQYVATAGAGCVTVGDGYYGRAASSTAVAQNATLARAQCPSGYRNGAATTAEANCVMNVAGGKYVAVAKESAASGTCSAGYAKAAHTVTYGNTSSCAACTGATYAATTGQASCTQCPTATNATDVASYSYYNKGGTNDHTVREGCYAIFKAKSVPNGNMTGYQCYIDKDTNDYGVAATGKTCWVNLAQLSCNGGYYNASANGGSTQYGASTLENLWNTACGQVGAGYWSAANALTRTQCTSGLTTIGYGAGADEADDCGRILHIGNDKVYLRSVKKTIPSLNVKVGDNIFYGNMSTAIKGKMRVRKDGTVYSVHDDSM